MKLLTTSNFVNKLEALDLFSSPNIQEEGLDYYAVGGCIRDMALGLKPKDIDIVVVGSSESDMLSRGFRKQGIDFPVFIHPVTRDEWALARLETSTGKGTNDFSCKTENVSLEEDLYRRDICFNAMAYNPSRGLFDPFNGLDDLKNNVIRHVSESFSEDPLRALRVARFSARYPDFKVDSSTLEIMKSQKDGLRVMAKERVWKELEKVLSSKRPSNYFRVLKSVNLLDVVHPIVFKMIGVEQSIKFHAEGDVFEHTLRALDQVVKITSNKKVVYATLYHDIGKAKSFKETGKLHNHDTYKFVFDEFAILKKQSHPKDYIKIGAIAAINHHFVHNFEELKPGTIAKRFLKIAKKIKDENGKIIGATPQVFPSNLFEMDALILVSKADELGRLLSDDENQPPLNMEEIDKIFEVNNEGFYIETVHLSKYKNERGSNRLSRMFRSFINKKIVYPTEFLELPKMKKRDAYADFSYKVTIDLIISFKSDCKC